MSLKLGNTDINGLFLGNTTINQAYLGNTEVFSSAPSNGLLNNLISYYELENNVLDSHGSNNGTNFGTSDTSGKILRGRSFDGVNDYIDTNLTLSGSASTIGFWYKHNNDNDYIISQGYIANGSGRWGLQAKTNNTLFLFQNPGSVISITSSVLTSGVWYYVQIKRASIDSWELLVDGVSQGTDTGGLALPSEDLFIGKLTTLYKNQSIDEIGVWGTALSTEKDTALYNSGAGLSYNDFTS